MHVFTTWSIEHFESFGAFTVTVSLLRLLRVFVSLGCLRIHIEKNIVDHIYLLVNELLMETVAEAIEPPSTTPSKLRDRVIVSVKPMDDVSKIYMRN